MISYKRATNTRGPESQNKLLVLKDYVSIKMTENIPKAVTLSGLNAGTIFENMRQGTVMLRTIWLVPRAAMAGRISALVIAKPQVTQNTLKS